MNVHRRPRGFTLVELLAVIAIIGLLIGLVVPSVGAARTHAKVLDTRNFLSAITKACEMFRNDNNRYPQSTGKSPFETGNVYLSGAQWLFLQTVGADGRGVVKPDAANDSNNDGVIDSRDWLQWYSLSPRRTYSRTGPYIDVKPTNFQTPEKYLTINAEASAVPTSLKAGSSEWKNEFLPFFIDSFRFPILYYAANAAEQTNAVWKGGVPGVYDPSDNSQFTGGASGDGRYPSAENGWLLTSSRVDHAFKVNGFIDSKTQPAAESFAGQIYDTKIFKTTQRGGSGPGRVWPRNPDTFLLISPGVDGRYGTADDIRNYEVTNE